MYEPTKIAETIKQMAKLKNIQLKDMLKSLSLNKNTLSNMYNGSMLKGDSLAKIADYLDCSVDYLLGRTDNPNSHKLVVSEAPKLSVAVRAARSFDDKPIEIVEVDESKFINAPEKKL